MKLILIRHGQTIENRKRIMQGHTHGTLSKQGIEQVRRVGLRLKDEKIDVIYSSDLARAVDTARAIAKHHPSVPIYLTEELRECDKGSITGKKADEIDWDNLPPDVETNKEMQERAKRIFDSVYGKHPEDTVVFVGHNGINKALITLMLGKSPEYVKEIGKLENTSISIFEIKNDKKKVELLNCARHLKD